MSGLVWILAIAVVAQLAAGTLAVLRLCSAGNRLILESASDGLCGNDTEGRVTFMNPAGAAMIGWEPAQLIGKYR